MARHNLALSHGINLSKRSIVAFPPNEIYYAKILLFPEPNTDPATRLAADTSGGGRFMAVHLRRGDMDNWRNRQHVCPEPRNAQMNTEGLVTC